jgi:hypothetical protein
MTKKLMLAIALLYSGYLSAQLKVNMFLAGRPPANLTEWANRKDVLTFVMGESGGQRFDVKLKTEIKTLDGTVIGATNLNTARPFSPLPAGSTILGALDVLPMENIVFTGRYLSAIQKTGKLPADNYMLCVQLLRLPDYAPASDVVCKNFYLAAYQLPVLMIPANEQELNASVAQTAITFRWTPVVPASTTPVTYHLQVFEILENQQDVQALRSNQPLLDRNIIGATQFIWQPQMSMMPYDNESDSLSAKQSKGQNSGVKGKKFIWTIQTLDNAGQPLNQTDGNGESRSEPHVFYVK